VSAVARGSTAAALARHGLRLESEGRLLTAPVRVSEDPAALGPQDLVVIAVKAPAMSAVAAGIAPLLGPDTVVLPAMNGVPWWFFHGFGGPCAGLRFESIDPGGRISAAIPDRHVIGCVVHLACSMPEPGLARHTTGDRLIIGEPSGAETPRVLALAGRLRAAGFDAPVSRRIQADIWYKLWGNMTTNPVSALTGATADRILDDPLVRRFCLAVMAEAAAIGARMGCPIAESGEDRMEVTRRLGAFRTSMLQDLEARRPPEIDALLTVVHEIGARIGVPTPNMDALLGLARLQARTLGLYA
ncbi:MAG: 2-dehydropantoate 2-reductase, partial [Rhodospirillaceae bacterium]|nr:2-dehydropantoate 2-reductase [Rhodospirillaceae bacterium]